MKHTFPKHPDALVNYILECNAPDPDEEDFWAIIIKSADSDSILFAQSGQLIEVAEAAAAFHKTAKPGSTQCLSFQGEKARWVLDEIWK